MVTLCADVLPYTARPLTQASRALRLPILAVLSGGALAAAPARAEPAPLRLDYETAGGGCPGAAVFLDEIQWRTDQARVVGPAEAALEVRARVVRRGPVTRGRLVLGTGKDAIVREVEGASCEEVVSALALITALALDPHASTATKRPAAPGFAPPPPPPPADAGAGRRGAPGRESRRSRRRRSWAIRSR